MIYTLQNLIDEWKLRRGLIPLRSDATFHRVDALDIDAALARGIDTWYQNLLDNAPASMLVIHDITDLLEVEHSAPGYTVYQLPLTCRRVIDVLTGPDLQPARPVMPESHEARLQDSPFSRAGSVRPVVCRVGNLLYVYGAEISRLTAIVTPPEGIYEMNPSALSTIDTCFTNQS